MPTKVTEIDVCRKIIDRRSDLFIELGAIGKNAASYDKAMFRRDMRSEAFLATTAVIDAKWDMLIADGIVVKKDGGFALDICKLYNAARVPKPKVRADCVRVIDRLTDTGEASE